MHTTTANSAWPKKEDAMVITMEQYFEFWRFWLSLWSFSVETDPKPQKWYWSWKCEKCKSTSGKMTLPPKVDPPKEIVCDVNKKCGGKMAPYRYVKGN